MKEEIKGDDELRAAFQGDTAADVLRALEGSERGRRFLDERLDSVPAGVRLQGDLVARVLVPDLEGEPGADRRGGPRLPRDRLRLPGRDRWPSVTTSAAAQDELMDGVPEGEGKRPARAGARALAADEPAHARPPLLHRPGRRTRASASPRCDRAEAGRGRRARRSRGRRLPPLQRAPPADGQP